MRDITDQVSSYMDAVVERVDVEDIAAQTVVRPQPKHTGLAPRLRWALAGATAAFSAIGAVAVFEWIARGGSTRYAAGGMTLRDAVASVPLWVTAVGAVAAGSLLTAGLFVVFAAVGQRLSHRGEKKMQTLERKQPTSETPTLSPLRRSVFAAAIVVLVMAVGFGTWMLVDEYTGVDRQIELLVKDYTAAWDVGDGEAVLDFMVPNGRHYSGAVPDGVSGEELADFVLAADTLLVGHFAVTGEPVILEARGEYLVTMPGWIGSETDPDWGFSVFVIDERDGELKILSHQWIDRDDYTAG